MKIAKTIAIIALMAVTAWLVWGWALPPGFWGGSMLSSPDETATQLAHRYFGPIILQSHWLHDKGVEPTEALISWGQMETVYRLVALVGMNLLIACVLIARIRKRTANKQIQGTGEPLRGSPSPDL